MKEYLKAIKPIRQLYDRFRVWSIESALRQQKLYNSYQFIGDIIGQYTTSELDTAYLQVKVRALHSFQKELINLAVLSCINSSDIKTVIDLGDSSGRHLGYVKELIGEAKYIGVNVDKEAIKKIDERGFIGVQGSIQSFIYNNPNIQWADLIMMFETLEHLEDPLLVLKGLRALSFKCKRLIITVPYVSRSRIGLHHLKKKGESFNKSPEDIHLFELSPYDWKLLFEYTGWEVVYEQIYYQYPRVLGLILKYYWRRFDFEGFWGAILKRGRE